MTGLPRRPARRQGILDDRLAARPAEGMGTGLELRPPAFKYGVNTSTSRARMTASADGHSKCEQCLGSHAQTPSEVRSLKGGQTCAPLGLPQNARPLDVPLEGRLAPARPEISYASS